MFQLFALKRLADWLEGMAEEKPAHPERAAPSPPPQSNEDLLSIYDPGPALRSRVNPADAPEFVYPQVSREAMGSLWEIYLGGTDRDKLIAAGELALEEIERLDRQLSHYKPESDLSLMNSHAQKQWVRLEPKMYDLLRKCHTLWEATGGALDISMLPVLRKWGFHDSQFRVPTEEELTEALASTGMGQIVWDDEEKLIYFAALGMELSLGAVGKGYALDEAADLLRVYEVESAVLHGGQSSIYALGGPPGSKGGWEFPLKDPRDRETVLETVYLRDQAIGVSGDYEQRFESAGKWYSHILDPRTGEPVQGMSSVTVIAPTAFEADALSTAFFVLGPTATEEYCKGRADLRVLMIEDDGASSAVTRIGFSK